MTYRLVAGDCLDALSEIEEASVDAVVTDPPYGLSAEPDAAEVLRHWLDGDDYQHRGGGFMGKSWDSFVPGPKVWAECLRVLKPGGHLVAFFGTRTVDLGGMAIRLAGFEIRDCLAWMYGSGFPKSLDVSKAIDKAAGAEREVVGFYESPEGTTGWKGQNKVGAVDFGASRYEDGERRPLTAPATEAARQWQGWGTALKPAFEPVILARKPLTGTVAANVQEFGTGALNVDGCRVGTQGGTTRSGESDRLSPQGAFTTGHQVAAIESGRWPANVILDEEAGAILDEQTGETKSPAPYTPTADRRESSMFGMGFIGHDKEYGDTGGASRFFYTAKASRAERNAGLDGFEERVAGAMRASQDGSLNGNIVTARNVHPTVKPIDLMRYLVRLVTPPGGTVLDPFTGSGTTGIAAGLEGFDFVGIERETEYREIAEARLKWWADKEGETAEILRRAGLVEKERKQHKQAGQTSLFEAEAA